MLVLDRERESRFVRGASNEVCATGGALLAGGRFWVSLRRMAGMREGPSMSETTMAGGEED